VRYFYLKEGVPVTLYLISLAFLAFWAWAGSRFATLNLGKLYNFLLGNSASIHSFLLYFFFSGPEGANLFFGWLSSITGLYVIPVVCLLHAGLLYLFNDLSAWSGKATRFLAALLLIAAFSLGFFCKSKKSGSNN